MSEPPRQPGNPEDPGIALPSWVDDAIARSRSERAAQSDAAADAGAAAEMAVNPPPPEKEAEPQWEQVPRESDPEHPSPVVVARSPRDARRHAVLPWVALALLFFGAALVIGYIMLTRPPGP